VYILGVNAAYHESAACLLQDGQVRVAIEEERLNRRKHAKLSSPDAARLLPWRAIKACLDYEGIGFEEVAHVGYSFDPQLLQEGLDRWRADNQRERGWPLERDSYQSRIGGLTFLEGVLSAKKQILEKPGFRGQFHFLPHHSCHAASTFHVSPFDRAAVLVLDGIGEWASTSLYRGEGSRLTRIGEFVFPNSLGFVWEKLCRYLGFTRYDATKVMGLAAYGDPSRTARAFSRLMDPATLTIDPDVLRHESPDFSSIEGLFGLPRRTEPLDVGAAGWQGYVDVAAGLQQLTERALFRLLEPFDPRADRYLCMAGGVALNCAANGAIARSGRFDDVFIQPAAHDAGTALGAAVLIWTEVLRRERRDVFTTAYLGPEYSDAEIGSVLRQTSLTYEKTDVVRAVARLIADGAIVGWFQGRMEWGPRALGNRSLLADPRNKAVRELLNVKVKHRERFRPFCPSVLAEKAPEWFDAGASVVAGKYMLTTSMARPVARESVPAVVHEDGTVRAQLVHRADNPLYYDLISAFERLTGVPLLLNTSFNDSEPIVCSPVDAIATFIKTGIDRLALGSYLVSKPC
jgi:carbamoyltransferase